MAVPIQIKQLCHTYMPGTPFESVALDHIDAMIEDGEFISLIGHTGSGKSTLIQHIDALLKPTSGTIVVNGLDVTEKTTEKRKIREKVGLVFQYPEHQLFEETVEKDIAFGPKNLGLGETECALRVGEAMQSVGLEASTAQRSPFELSGGQRRRVAIAGVLAMQTEILILDEPTAGLDPRGREDILTLIKRLHDEKKMTIIMATHSMDDAARLSDRIFVMNEGRMAMMGTPADVFARAEELEGMHLRLPEAALLVRQLNACGYDLPTSIFDIREISRRILQHKGLA